MIVWQRGSTNILKVNITDPVSGAQLSGFTGNATVSRNGVPLIACIAVPMTPVNASDHNYVVTFNGAQSLLDIGAFYSIEASATDGTIQVMKRDDLRVTE